jgi:cellulose synthase (UDP-forming)
MLVFFFLPYWFCQAISLSWLTGGHRSAFWSEVYETMLCFPMSLTVVTTLIRPFGKPFKVSKKGETKAGLTFNPVVGAPLLVLLGLYVPTLVYACMNARWYPSPGIFVLAVAWSIYSMVLLWLSLQASLDVPLLSKAIRFKYQLPGSIRAQGTAFDVFTAEVSDTDIILETNKELSTMFARASQNGTSLSVTIPACGLVEAPIAFCESAPGERTHIRLGKLPLDQHRRLIAFLYCRPGQWDERGVCEPVTFWHFIEAIFRMFPLAES